MLYLAIVLAGGSGALLRYLLSRALLTTTWVSLPIATLVANVVGSFLIGYLSWMFVHRWQLSNELQVAILTGLLGGFTTFSTFSLEVVTLFENGLTARAITYIFLSVTLSILMCLCGLYLARQT